MASAHVNFALAKYLGGTIVPATDTIKVRLLRSSAYTFSQTHEFLTSLPAAIVADVTLGSKSVPSTSADGGTFDAADAVFVAVPAGAAIDALEIYKDTGVAATSSLMAYIDGFTVTPNGNDITLVWQNTNPFIFKV